MVSTCVYMVCVPSWLMSLMIAKSILVLAGAASGGVDKAVGNVFRLQFTILTPVTIDLHSFFLCFLTITVGLVS